MKKIEFFLKKRKIEKIQYFEKLLKFGRLWFHSTSPYSSDINLNWYRLKPLVNRVWTKKKILDLWFRLMHDNFLDLLNGTIK